MIIHPKIRGFICTTAHPQGCKQAVLEQIHFVKQQLPLEMGPKKVLIIGASTGYGLASRIASTFGAKAQTIGVFFEKEAQNNRTASPGWYNTVAFEKAAHQEGLYAKSINGDAFSNEIKAKTIALIQDDWQGEVDLVIYSLASPRRCHPETGEIFSAVLKPIGQPFSSKTIDVTNSEVKPVHIEPANPSEIEQTIQVMGGEDWARWMQALSSANVLAPRVKTVAYSYIGPTLTHPIYWEGTIGEAKKDLEKTARHLNETLKTLQGEAFICVNKAIVTQASAAIPVVPLYLSLLYKVMKEKNLHEGAIHQIWRLFLDKLYTTNHAVPVDAQGLIRMDDWEMLPEVQSDILQQWDRIDTKNVMTTTDFQGYRREFHQLFGFDMPGVHYDSQTEPDVAIPSLAMEVA